MTPDRLAAIALRCFIFAVSTLLLLVPHTQAQSNALIGVYCVAANAGQHAKFFSESFASRESALVLQQAYQEYLTEKYHQEFLGVFCD